MKIKSIFITAVLTMAVLCSTGFVNAQATDNSALIAQLQAQIQSLMQQIQQLVAQQQGGQTWCHTFNTNLGVGSNSPEVDMLATALSKTNFLSVTRTYSDFDENLASAVVKFQAKYGIIQTGYVGPLTRAKLNTLYGCKQTTSNVCTSVSFSDWSACSSNGARFRTITSAFPTGCDTGDIVLSGPCPTVQTPVTVVSPNGGERLVKGSTYNITWATSSSFSADYPQVTITLIAGSNGQAVLPDQRIVTNNTGNYSWTVPNVPLTAYIQDYPAGPYTLKNVDNQNIFKFQIEGYPHKGSPMASGPLDNSDNYFAITATSTNPSTTVSSPVSTDVWQAGKTYNVVWNPSVFEDKVSIALVNKDNNKVCDFDGIANTGTYAFTVPTQTGFGSCDDGSNLTGSHYQIKVWTKAATLTSQIFSVSNPSGLQTYTNSNVGYTIQYPSVYAATTSNCYLYNGQNQVNDANSIMIGDTDNRLVHICYFDGTMQDFVSNFGDNNWVSTTFNGYRAYKDDFDMPYSSGRTKYLIQRDASHVLFIDETWAGTLKDTTDKIVSSMTISG